ncbi:ead/Ea22-like family protein [Edwardsiella piscicida]|uniref:ead/Ea22-like family protein n=1 Tax=Edwardsiella piscicida TaxID=1263550 RepID=UPI00370D771F
MSQVDKQALREAAVNAKIAGEAPVIPFDQRIDALNSFTKLLTPSTAIALLYEIAALEAELETADKLQDSAFRNGLQHGFSYGQTNDQAGYEQCLKSYSSRGKDNG